MEINLRKAVDTDAQEIAKIHVSSWKSAFDGLMPADYINGFTVSSRLDEWQKAIRNNTETVVVAERSNKVVGFMSYFVPTENPDTIELSKLYLCPSVYGQRLGSSFLTHLEQESQTLRTTMIKLYVLDNNEAAIQFYSKNGFEFADGFMSEEFEGSVIIDLLMVKRV
ncbi:GNAT family N-acetyltransferase [Enterovibrio sp. ZSDZ35]|uniref:GNAT family N-acetyltransferase n=1 Tax=Enterovibrio qingdaonensis TaxID=2899818 RepID=A0ABT5QHN5_9GAMM|nr:GNAT family N-acetyltransferase [Enterovibrio sp. ZSDZ35]MDD1780364.1 GNAT family N-acetyltransferase [Enterovibrio sp. ZSDZ35]